LDRVAVRGLEKVRSVALPFTLAHNFRQTLLREAGWQRREPVRRVPEPRDREAAEATRKGRVGHTRRL